MATAEQDVAKVPEKRRLEEEGEAEAATEQTMKKTRVNSIIA